MKYTLSYQEPSKQYLNIELEVLANHRDSINFQLPAWRPGRYELGNFAKNVQKWAAFDENNNALAFKKRTKDLWEVKTKGAKKVVVKYNYYSNELNAGSTFLSINQLYVNPVNCLLYAVGWETEECIVKLKIPNSFKCAIALPAKNKTTFIAKDFDELADSPFIASDRLQHHEFDLKQTRFHLWFQGEFKADWDRLEKDFKAYSLEQIKLFGDFPTKEYHYLFQILPHSAYHGVEHSACTVIALGPSYNILKKEGRYDDLLGVSSHELFHTWNVKRIRPQEMQPYDFTKENYSRLGYLAEGATTWYGDLMLYRSNVFDDEAFFKTFGQLLNRHYNNPGVNNLSVAESSFDTWLDGYSLGVPNRKSSIYTEGALITFMLDIEIRKKTKNRKSFDDVLRSFYKEYYKKGKGIREEDYRNEIEAICESSMASFFKSYVNGTEDISKKLDQCLKYIGLQRTQTPAKKFEEAYLGVRQNSTGIVMIYPDSPADLAGLSVHDKIVSINGYPIKDDLSDWLEYFREDKIMLTVSNGHGRDREVRIALNDSFYYSENKVFKSKKPTKQQVENQKSWMKTN